jgi:uncharacterized protein with FMN-binding domain
MHRGLVALSASAIAAVYTVGLLHTQPAASLAATAPIQEVTQSTPVARIATLLPTPVPTQPVAPPPVPGGRGSRRAPNGSAAIPAAPVATPTPASPAPAASVTASYRDGTYAGAGTSRFGNVEVAVTVQGGRIANVALTRVTTKYPASRIAALPGQVVSRQSAQVDNVSGATASAQAFRTAVQQALGKAVAA